MDIEEGYYKTFSQEWFEDEEGKNGWSSCDWDAPEDYELVEILDTDKFGNPTLGLFRYTKAVFLGFPHAAFNIQASLLSDFVDIARQNEGKTFKDLERDNPEFSKLNTAIEVIEEKFKTKKFFKNSKS